MKRRKLTGLEILGLVILVLLFLLVAFMIVMAVIVSVAPSVAHAANVTSGKAWTASLVAMVIASTWARLLMSHFDRVRNRRRGGRV